MGVIPIRGLGLSGSLNIPVTDHLLISSGDCGTCRGRHSYQGAGPFWHPEHPRYQTIFSSHLVIVERGAMATSFPNPTFTQNPDI